jgi:superkiller protein 8
MVHSTTDPDFPLAQSIDGAHKVGCHHVVTNGNGSKAVSVGFDGEIKVWSCHNGTWSEDVASPGKDHLLYYSVTPYINNLNSR